MREGRTWGVRAIVTWVNGVEGEGGKVVATGNNNHMTLNGGHCCDEVSIVHAVLLFMHIYISKKQNQCCKIFRETNCHLLFSNHDSSTEFKQHTVLLCYCLHD